MECKTRLLSGAGFFVCCGGTRAGSVAVPAPACAYPVLGARGWGLGVARLGAGGVEAELLWHVTDDLTC